MTPKGLFRVHSLRAPFRLLEASTRVRHRAGLFPQIENGHPPCVRPHRHHPTLLREVAYPVHSAAVLHAPDLHQGRVFVVVVVVFRSRVMVGLEIVLVAVRFLLPVHVLVLRMGGLGVCPLVVVRVGMGSLRLARGRFRTTGPVTCPSHAGKVHDGEVVTAVPSGLGAGDEGEGVREGRAGRAEQVREDVEG